LGILEIHACITTSWLQCWGIVELAVISSLLEELRIVMFAVKSPFKGCIIGGADCATTMDTFEAVLMIWETFHTCFQGHQKGAAKINFNCILWDGTSGGELGNQVQLQC
jgi:hypothetical protein